jgi:cell filamentation protein
VTGFRSWDDFLWPGTTVLRNKLDLRDQDQLEVAERGLAAGRIVQCRTVVPPVVTGAFDVVFQDVYEWAGQLRPVGLARPGVTFCRPELLESFGADIAAGIKRKDFLRGLDGGQFAELAGEVLGDLNALHPFREGNGRTQRVFMELLAAQAGHVIVWPADMADRNTDASIASFRGDSSGLAALIGDSLVTPPVSGVQYTDASSPARGMAASYPVNLRSMSLDEVMRAAAAATDPSSQGTSVAGRSGRSPGTPPPGRH